jgi:6-pyruvoyltetrahydropterin/6-carboxytetrahydropterin synthase
MVHLSRIVTFSASHFYRVQHWSDEENERVFGLCSNIHGHGHDYKLTIMVRGNVDPKTGIVINTAEIKDVANEWIGEKLDGKFLNHENPYFKERLSTTENLVSYIWDLLEPQIHSCELHKLRLYENDWLFSEKGRDTVVHLTRKYHFSAAHRLHSNELSEEENLSLFGKCNNPHGHGHNYYLEVTVSGQPDPTTGMIINLSDLDRTVENIVLKKFDHKHLNLDTQEFKDLNPTSDNFVVVLWNLLAPHLPELTKIGLWETEKNYFEYHGPNELE